jgi:predicted DNA-binding transcriptional regulator AlpA
MQMLNTESIDFSNSYATLCERAFCGEKNQQIRKENTYVKKKNVRALPTDSNLALMKLAQVLSHLQISRSSWLEGVRIGRYPAPVRLSPRRVAWRVSDIQAFVDSL